MKKYKKIAVSGGTGFIGSHVTEVLVNAGYEVTLISHSGNYSNNIYHLKDKINLIAVDLSNSAIMEEALSDMDVVIHLSWSTVPQTSSLNPSFDVESNIVEGIKMLEACVKNEVKKVVFLSSGGTVYGEVQELPINESHPKTPISSYGISKLTFEKYLQFFQHNHGLNYLIFRTSNVYGPKQNLAKNQGVIGVWLKQILSGKKISVWGDGSVIRDYLYVTDVAEAILKGLESDIQNDIFNLGSGKGNSLKEIIETMQEVVDENVEVAFQEARSIDVKSNVLDIKKLEAAMEWNPQVDLLNGIKFTYEWMKSQ